MPVRNYIPTVRYGNKVGIDEVASGSIVAVTNGTGAVSVFGTDGLFFPIVITRVTSTALDTTTGNITVENPAGTVVATIAKGATAGALVGAITLANITVASGTNLIVKSSTAGNSSVEISYIAG